MANRRSSESPAPPPWTPRRSTGGARKELTERVTIRAPGFEATGWTLNVSRGGLRAIVESRLAPDVEYEVTFGDATSGRRVLLVWSKEENDGQIVGMKYLDSDGSVPPFEDPFTDG